MKALEFRVQNYRSIEDSGWIKLEQVTAFVGRNESGKTTLLKALHKFNPATPEPYDALKEFPRDRYMRDYVAGSSKGSQNQSGRLLARLPGTNVTIEVLHARACCKSVSGVAAGRQTSLRVGLSNA